MPFGTTASSIVAYDTCRARDATGGLSRRRGKRALARRPLRVEADPTGTVHARSPSSGSRRRPQATGQIARLSKDVPWWGEAQNSRLPTLLRRESQGFRIIPGLGPSVAR